MSNIVEYILIGLTSGIIITGFQIFLSKRYARIMQERDEEDRLWREEHGYN